VQTSIDRHGHVWTGAGRHEEVLIENQRRLADDRGKMTTEER